MTDETAEIYEGKAVNGPYNGLSLEGRQPKGILFVDKASDTVYIYDWHPHEREFYGRDSQPIPMDEQKRLDTAQEWGYEVRAAIEEEKDKWRL